MVYSTVAVTSPVPPPVKETSVNVILAVYVPASVGAASRTVSPFLYTISGFVTPSILPSIVATALPVPPYVVSVGATMVSVDSISPLCLPSALVHVAVIVAPSKLYVKL